MCIRDRSNGVVSKILKTEGETVLSSEVIGEFSESEGKPETLKKNNETIVDLKEDKNEETEVERDNKKISPAAKKIIIENNIETENVKSSGKNNRITKADVINHISPDIEESSVLSEFSEDDRPQKRVPMSRLRSTIAKRLVSVKQDTAMLTTFNEVDMLPIKDLRSKYGEEFEKEHGVKLGFMGFFVVAAVQALKKFPMVNASIDKNDIVYHGFQDIGVAVSTERGLVVPIIKDADTKSLSEIEKSILEYSKKAKEGKLSIDEMQGGTFTISNGGVFGSLLSTPILNAPQTAILECMLFRKDQLQLLAR